MAGTLIVSLDFELFWGMLDCSTLEEYQDHVLGGRKAIPELLKLFETYGIHATWAAVGFLFGEDRADLQRFFPEPGLRPTYENPALDPYAWFDKIGEDEQSAPCFYGASLLREVAKHPGQEIGSHTFCHFYCREKGQTLRQFEADMKAAKEIAREKGFPLTSVILPRNQCRPEYTGVLRDLGFTAYRDEERDWIHRHVKITLLKKILRTLDMYLPLTGKGGYIPREENGIWNLVGSRMFRPIGFAGGMLEGLKVKRICSQMRHAAKKGLTFHLWWHPHNVGVRTEEHLRQLEEIFHCYAQLRETYGMQSLNMAEAAAQAGGKT